MALCTISLIHNPWWTDAAPLLHQGTFPRLLLALLLGVCIGAERQWRQRAAGLRTNTLVCLGAAAFVDLGLTIAPNTTQVVAYVVSGVGFLGAGAIMKDGANVRGLNTAATLWCSAAVGACAGAGELLDSIFVALLLLGINSALRPLSRYIDRRSLASVTPQFLYRVRILCAPGHQGEARQHLENAVPDRSFTINEIREQEDEEAGTWLVQAVLESPTKNDKALHELTTKLHACPWIESVDILSSDAETE